MRARLATLLVGLLAGYGLLVAGASPAWAHAALLSTSPTDQQLLDQSPAEVTLTFSEPVGLSLGGVRVVTDQGARVDTGDSRRTDGGTVVHMSLRPDLADGTYAVLWRVQSADAHPVSGAFTFVVGAPSVDPAELLGRGDLTSLIDPPRGPGLALGVARFAGFAALLCFLGPAVFRWRLWQSGSRGVVRLQRGAAGVGVASAAAALLLQGPYVAGLGLSSALDAALFEEVLRTQYGGATVVRIALALAAAALAASPRAGVVLGTAWALTLTLAGHAGAGGGQPWTALTDVLHLAAVSTWVGGLVVLLLGLRRGWFDERAVLPRWSTLATSAVVVLTVTGVAASWREVGQLGALTSTDYGHRLLVKTGLVGLMLLLGLAARVAVRELATGSADALAAVRRSVALESAVAVVVVGITAALVSTTPAKAAYAPPYLGRSQAGPLTVALDVYPAKRGVNGLHIYTVGAGSRTVDVPEVTGYVERPDGGDRITLRLVHKSLGHFEDLNVVLPGRGQWTVHLQVRVDNFTTHSTAQTLVAR